MAPTKLNVKKKRAAGSPSSNEAPQACGNIPHGGSRVSADGSAAQDGVSETLVSSMTMTLDQAARFYGQLVGDCKRLRLRLEFSLWVYEIVALAVANALMHEEIAAVALAALWLGRGFLLKHLTAERTAQSDWKRLIAFRALLFVAFTGVFIAVHVYCVGQLTRDRVTTLGVVATLDVISVVNSIFSTHANAALKTTHAIEIVFMTGIFSTQYNHQPYLIYDGYALFLTLGVSVAHFFVVDSVCSAVFTTTWISSDDASRNQLRRWDAIENVQKLLDHGKAATARGKNKELTEINALRNERRDPSEWPTIRTNTDTMSELSRCIAAQTGVVFVQLVATSWFLYSWELGSLLMGTSIVLLFEVLRLQWSFERTSPLPSSVDDFLTANS